MGKGELGQHSLSLVIPCYNEAEAVDWLFRSLKELSEDAEFKKMFSSFEVLIVDDGSDQNIDWPHSPAYVRKISHSRRRGYGAAIKTGLLQSRGDLVGFFDLDGSYLPSDLIHMVKRLQTTKSSVVYGNRLHSQSRMPLVRRIGNNFYSLLVRYFLRSTVKDVCTGWRLMTKEVKDLCLTVPENGLNFSMALTTRLILSGVPQSETEIAYCERKGQSKLIVSKDGFLFLWPVMKGFCVQVANHRFWTARKV